MGQNFVTFSKNLNFKRETISSFVNLYHISQTCCIDISKTYIVNHGKIIYYIGSKHNLFGKNIEQVGCGVVFGPEKPLSGPGTHM